MPPEYHIGLRSDVAGTAVIRRSHEVPAGTVDPVAKTFAPIEDCCQIEGPILIQLKGERRVSIDQIVWPNQTDLAEILSLWE